MGETQELVGPDLERGVDQAEVREEQPLLGHFRGEAVMLVKRGNEVLAVGARCTHYGGPLAEGLIAGETVRCPWHHACFSLRSGEALRAPALNPIPCYEVVERERRLVVLGKAKPARPAHPAAPAGLASVVIVGAGAAGLAAAEMLRREGYAGKLTLIGADPAPPCDRPNLSKDYLAGNAPEEWIPLYPDEFYAKHDIELVLGARVERLDLAQRRVVLEGGASHPYDALLLATGAEPRRLDIEIAPQARVFYLRTLADSRAIIAALASARRAVVLGASFIGLEVAASLRARGLDVHVVAPDARPLERVLGPQLGDHVRGLHEKQGVHFHLGQTARSIEKDRVVLANGTALDADLVVAGIGVDPSLALMRDAGLKLDRGVVVDEYLETSSARVFAAGDIARWPDPHSAEPIRVEHWVVAERLGQLAARNILGRKQPCRIVPFFWSQHYDVTISYVGHASQWDRIDIEGNLSENDCRATFSRAGRRLAVVTIGRDRESLRAELEMESS